MDNKFGTHVFGGTIIGAILGLIWTASSNPLIGLGIGALVGTFIGWFIATAVLENQKKDNK